MTRKTAQTWEVAPKDNLGYLCSKGFKFIGLQSLTCLFNQLGNVLGLKDLTRSGKFEA